MGEPVAGSTCKLEGKQEMMMRSSFDACAQRSAVSRKTTLLPAFLNRSPEYPAVIPSCYEIYSCRQAD
jgi:hypothetical protein